MAVMGIRDFSRKISSWIENVETTGEPVVITRHGRAVAALVPVNSSAFEDLILANAPAFIEDMASADAELAAGETSTLEETLAAIDAEESRAKTPDATGSR